MRNYYSERLKRKETKAEDGYGVGKKKARV